MLGDLALQTDSSDAQPVSAADQQDQGEVRRNAAEGYYLRALEIAREQGARSFALRAAASIARLMERDGRIDEAIELVAPLRTDFDGQRPTPDTTDVDMLMSRLRSAAKSESQAH